MRSQVCIMLIKFNQNHSIRMWKWRQPTKGKKVEITQPATIGFDLQRIEPKNTTLAWIKMCSAMLGANVGCQIFRIDTQFRGHSRYNRQYIFSLVSFVRFFKFQIMNWFIVNLSKNSMKTHSKSNLFWT